MPVITGLDADFIWARFTEVAPPCLADFAPPMGVLDFNDVLGYLTAFGASDPSADLAAPIGALDFNDVVAFLGAFAEGCP